ncbi:hypothetical protein [Methanosarcina barkeri]|nr:hypothetical protein [Methanosarcina barkeri]
MRTVKSSIFIILSGARVRPDTGPAVNPKKQQGLRLMTFSKNFLKKA